MIIYSVQWLFRVFIDRPVLCSCSSLLFFFIMRFVYEVLHQELFSIQNQPPISVPYPRRRSSMYIRFNSYDCHVNPPCIYHCYCPDACNIQQLRMVMMAFTMICLLSCDASFMLLQMCRSSMRNFSLPHERFLL